VDDAGDVAPLLRQVDAGDLEQRDALVVDREVEARGVDEARYDRLPQDHRLGGDGEARRVRLRETAADERLLDHAPQALLAREAAEADVLLRQRERDLAQLVARDLLDEVDLARDVARAPGGHAVSVGLRLEAELREDRGLLRSGDDVAEQLV